MKAGSKNKKENWQYYLFGLSILKSNAPSGGAFAWGRYGAEDTLGTTRGRAGYMSGVRSEARWVHLKGTTGYHCKELPVPKGWN